MIAGPTYIRRATDQLLYRVIDSETIIVKLDGEGPYILNPVGSAVWELADGRRTIDEIVATICKVYDVEPGTAFQDIVTWAEWLAERDLLTVSTTTPDSG
jgi:hypothetical protein